MGHLWRSQGRGHCTTRPDGEPIHRRIYADGEWVEEVTARHTHRLALEDSDKVRNTQIARRGFSANNVASLVFPVSLLLFALYHTDIPFTQAMESIGVAKS